MLCDIFCMLVFNNFRFLFHISHVILLLFIQRFTCYAFFLYVLFSTLLICVYNIWLLCVCVCESTHAYVYAQQQDKREKVQQRAKRARTSFAMAYTQEGL